MSQVRTGDLLSFGDYSPERGADRSARIDVEAVHGNVYTGAPPPPGGAEFSEPSSPGAAGDESAPSKSNHNFWTLEYYQKYFDVQTSEVVERIMSSVVPLKVSRNYFDERIRGKPDLYGPVWISVTLIFTIAVSGNIASYLQNAHRTPQTHWRYDFHLLSYAATAIFCYVWLVPLALWAALKFTTPQGDTDSLEDQKPSTPSMMSLFCLYGYSLSIYVPVCVLWTIQVFWLQWLFVLTAAFVSGAVLIFWLMPALRKSRYFPIIMGSILGFHLLLATGFMMYFFRSAPGGAVQAAVATTEATVRAVAAAGQATLAAAGKVASAPSIASTAIPVP